MYESNKKIVLFRLCLMGLLSVPLLGAANMGRLPRGNYVPRPEFQLPAHVALIVDSRLDECVIKLQSPEATKGMKVMTFGLMNLATKMAKFSFDVGSPLSDVLAESVQASFQEVTMIQETNEIGQGKLDNAIDGILKIQVDPETDIILQSAKEKLDWSGAAKKQAENPVLQVTIKAELFSYPENTPIWSTQISVRNLADAALGELASELQYLLVTDASVAELARGNVADGLAATHPGDARGELLSGLRLARQWTGRLPEVIENVSFGSSEQLKNKGVCITPSVAVCVQSLSLGRYEIEPSAERLLALSSQNKIQIVFEMFGDAPDFAQALEFALVQDGQEALLESEPLLARVSPCWPKSPSYFSVLTLSAPLTAIHRDLPVSFVVRNADSREVVDEHLLDLSKADEHSLEENAK